MRWPNEKEQLITLENVTLETLDQLNFKKIPLEDLSNFCEKNEIKLTIEEDFFDPYSLEELRKDCQTFSDGYTHWYFNQSTVNNLRPYGEGFMSPNQTAMHYIHSSQKVLSRIEEYKEETIKAKIQLHLLKEQQKNERLESKQSIEPIDNSEKNNESKEEMELDKDASEKIKAVINNIREKNDTFLLQAVTDLSQYQKSHEMSASDLEPLIVNEFKKLKPLKAEELDFLDACRSAASSIRADLEEYSEEHAGGYTDEITETQTQMLTIFSTLNNFLSAHYTANKINYKKNDENYYKKVKEEIRQNFRKKRIIELAQDYCKQEKASQNTQSTLPENNAAQPSFLDDISTKIDSWFYPKKITAFNNAPRVQNPQPEQKQEMPKEPSPIRYPVEIHNDENSMRLEYFIVGDPGVGKSALREQYINNYYYENYSYLFEDLSNKQLTTALGSCKLQLREYPKDDRHVNTVSFYKNAHAVIVTFDITNKQSFLSMEGWLRDIARYAKKDVCIVIVGMKADLANDRAVDEVEALSWIEENFKNEKISYYEVSAKTGEGVANVFEPLLYSKCLSNYLAMEIKNNNGTVKLIFEDYANKSAKTITECQAIVKELRKELNQKPQASAWGLFYTDGNAEKYKESLNRLNQLFNEEGELKLQGVQAQANPGLR